MKEVMLTTIDNPYDPFTQFDEWFGFDESKGYHTCAYLARIARSSSELSLKDQSIANEQAIDSICSENILGIYRKVVKDESNEDVDQSDES